MMNIGYARVSTQGQDFESQREALAAVDCTRIFSEKISGAKQDRPQLVAALDYLRDGDTLIVTRLDRLARSTKDLLEIAEKINNSKAGLRSLAEPWADTTSPAGRMMLTICAGIADFERSLILDRTADGRVRAMERGVRFGPPRSLKPEQIAHAKELMETKSVMEIAKLLGVHRATIYRALKE